MRREAFPDPASYDYQEWTEIGEYFFRSEGVIAFGTPLTAANVREAYLKGIFPWHTDGLPLPWHCPARRAILDFDKLNIPRSLAQARRKTTLKFTIDTYFHEVMHQCSLVPRPGQHGTWITPGFKEVFGILHDEGMAHSVEAWNGEQLVGGLYGVDAGGVFCGESMFYREPYASKLSLLFLIDHLKSRGSTWLDSQVMVPHMQKLGAVEIDRSEFLQKLKTDQAKNLNLFG